MFILWKEVVILLCIIGTIFLFLFFVLSSIDDVLAQERTSPPLPCRSYISGELRPESYCDFIDDESQ